MLRRRGMSRIHLRTEATVGRPKQPIGLAQFLDLRVEPKTHLGIPM